MTEKQRLAIDDIMDNFDFHKVHRVMEFMNWQWRGEGVPSVSEMRKEARRLLLSSMKDSGQASTGGFLATYEEYEKVGGVLELKFVIEEWDWDEESGVDE